MRHQKHITRRDALKRGLFGTAGVLLAGRLGDMARADDVLPAQTKAKAKSVIQVFLWGGMSHTDTWDPKPDAGYDYTGQFKAVIPTNVDGIRLGALFPALAKNRRTNTRSYEA